jgi:transposase
MDVLYLKSQGLAHQDIRRLCNISKTTLTTYLRQYLEGGIERLKHLDYRGQPSELNAHADSVETYFRDHPPLTIAEAQAKIAELTGIHTSPNQVNAFLTTFLGYLWCFSRVFIKSPAGRKRFNVLGALNALTLEIITVTNETYINAESVCQLLQKLSDLALGIPITLVWDNARYQKCAAVFELAEQLGITLVYLPSDSPHLNLIERLWRFVRKECLYSKYYADFSAFKSAISTLIDTACQRGARQSDDWDYLMSVETKDHCGVCVRSGATSHRSCIIQSP